VDIISCVKSTNLPINLIIYIFCDKCYIVKTKFCFNICVLINVRKEVEWMEIGTNVIFNGEDYTIRWLYDNGKCEIKKQDGLKEVKLVSLSDLEIIGKAVEYC